MIYFLFILLSATLTAAEPFQGSATLLYLKPTLDDTHYVLSSVDNFFGGTQFPKGKRYQNSAPFTPGFSLEGLYAICPNTSCLDTRFTYFSARSKDSVSGEFLYDTNGFPGFGAQDSPIYNGTARSKNDYHFYTGDITYNRSFDFLPDRLVLIIGMHGAYINFKEHSKSSGTFLNRDMIQQLSNHLHRNSEFFGIGPQIGLDYQWLLSPCGSWALKVDARGSLLCGKIKSDLRFITLRTGPEGVGVKNGDLWRIIPTATAELGIQYKYCSLQCEFGYEILFYDRCVNKITGLDVVYPGDVIDNFNNFTLHGPFLRISTAF